MARAAMFALIAALALAGPAGTAESDLPPKGADEGSAALDAAPASGQAANPPVLDYDFFVKRVQPIFLSKRKGLARCYVCHSQATNFRLQRLATGANAWSEAESRLNFDATKRFAVPGDPMESRLVTMHALRAPRPGRHLV